MIFPKDWSTMKKLMFMQQIGSGSSVIEDTVSGNPCVFTTDLAKPLSRLAVSLLPRQSGTGDPSPENIRPLLPWGEVGTWTGGKNLLPNLKVQDTANRVSLGVSAVSDRIFLKAGTYRISFGVTSGQEALAFWMTYGKDRQATSTAKSTNPFTLTEDTLIRIWLYNGNGIPADNVEWWQLESGSQATAYESPTITPHPVNVGNITPPVYGCELDLTTGEVWGTWASFSAKWKDGKSPSVRGDNTRKLFSLPNIFVRASGSVTAYCNVAKWVWDYEVDSIHFYLNRGASYVFLPNDTDGETDILIVGKLETPVLLATLTPQQINALIGVNTVWSDADNVDVTYLKKG